MNHVYLNDHQNPNLLAQRPKLSKPQKSIHTEHMDTNLSRNDLPEGDYVELSDLGLHRTNINFHRRQMINKGKNIVIA